MTPQAQLPIEASIDHADAASIRRLRYVLVTPARNEADLIAQTIECMLRQTRRPERWVIVSDGSTDATDAIVTSYAAAHDWIRLVRRSASARRSFAGKVGAFDAGHAALGAVDHDIVGNLDADVTFADDHFEFLLDRFARDERLGVAGTPFSERGGHYDYRFTNIEHVSGACQLFRRRCFAEIGGYRAVAAGGVDWLAVTTARMMGWRTRTFCDRVCQHHRPMGSALHSALGARFRAGAKDYALGGHPVWQCMRGLYQTRYRPVVLGGALLVAGYAWAWLMRRPVEASPELVAFHRGEQMSRLRAVFRARPGVEGVDRGSAEATP